MMLNDVECKKTFYWSLGLVFGTQIFLKHLLYRNHGEPLRMPSTSLHKDYVTMCRVARFVYCRRCMIKCTHPKAHTQTCMLLPTCCNNLSFHSVRMCIKTSDPSLTHTPYPV